jgi:hypothetical protein
MEFVASTRLLGNDHFFDSLRRRFKNENSMRSLMKYLMEYELPGGYRPSKDIGKTSIENARASDTPTGKFILYLIQNGHSMIQNKSKEEIQKLCRDYYEGEGRQGSNAPYSTRLIQDCRAAIFG